MSHCWLFISSVTFYLFVSILSLLLSLFSSLQAPSLSPSTSPVSGVLDSRCSDQWAPVVLGALPLLNHQSCTNLHNSPSRAQPHQSYPRRTGALSNTHTHTLTYIFTTVPGVCRLEVCPLCWFPELNVTDWMWPCSPCTWSWSYSWHLQDTNGLIGTPSPSGSAEVRPPRACESVLLYCRLRVDLWARETNMQLGGPLVAVRR